MYTVSKANTNSETEYKQMEEVYAIVQWKREVKSYISEPNTAYQACDSSTRVGEAEGKRPHLRLYLVCIILLRPPWAVYYD